MLFCDGFFDCTSVPTESVAEMKFSLAYILNVAFIAPYHINEIGRKDRPPSPEGGSVGQAKKNKK